MVLVLPDPARVDESVGIVLRHWGAPGDPAALAAAWADPEIARHTAVPADASHAAAARWIAGEGERRRRGLALDLVVDDLAEGGEPSVGGGRVLGEVGLAHLDREGRAEIGFWSAPAARGRGVATAAVHLLTRWALAVSHPSDVERAGLPSGPGETGHPGRLPGHGPGPAPDPGPASDPGPAPDPGPASDPGPAPDPGPGPSVRPGAGAGAGSGPGSAPGGGSASDSGRAPGPGPGPDGLGLRQLWARTTPGDVRAAGVLRRAGYRHRGDAAGSAVWTVEGASLRA